MADTFQYAKLPDGTWGKFAPGATPDQMRAIVNQKFPGTYSNAAPAPLSGAIGPAPVPQELQGAPAPPPTPHGSKLSDISNTDVAKGIGETLAQNVASGGHILSKIPLIGQHLAPDAETQNWQDLARPENDDQRLGKTVGNIGENVALAIAAPEVEGAGLLPALGRIGGQAAIQGIVSKAQGGTNKDALESTALGTGGGVLGEIGRLIAPTLAESAIGVKGADRSYGANPGKAILEHTQGFRPSTITESAKDAIDQAANNSRALAVGSKSTVNLEPAADEAIRQTTNLQDQLFRDPSAEIVENRLMNPFGKIPELQTVPLDNSLTARTGVGSLARWNELQPGSQDLSSASKPVYKLVTDAIHQVPGIGPKIEENDQIIHSLLPVKERANAADLNANLLQRALGRIGAHTGSLALGGILGAGGYHQGGIGEGFAGLLAGILGPELLSNPTAVMAAARVLNQSPALAKAATAGVLGSINGR